MNWLAYISRSARMRRHVLLGSAALGLHIAVLGPVLMLRLERIAPVRTERISFDIVEVAKPEPSSPGHAAEPAMRAPPPQSSELPEPAAKNSQVKPEKTNLPEVPDLPEVSVPEVTLQPSTRQGVILRPAPTRPPANPSHITGGQIGSDVQLALRSVFCRDMTEWQRQDAGCDSVEAAREQYAPLYEATPLSDYQRIQEIYAAQLASTRRQGQVEAFLTRNNGVPATMPGGIDNQIFMPARPATQGALERIRRGQKPDWEEAVRRAHGTD